MASCVGARFHVAAAFGSGFVVWNTRAISSGGRLGRVGGFNQDQATRECDEGTVTLGSLFASQGDTLEAFQFAHRLLDSGLGFVERLREENHAHGIAIYMMHYNFVRIHQTLRCTPAVAAGVTMKLWELADMVAVLEEWEARQG